MCMACQENLFDDKKLILLQMTDAYSFHKSYEEFQNILCVCEGYFYHSSLHDLTFPIFFCCYIHPESFMKFQLSAMATAAKIPQVHPHKMQCTVKLKQNIFFYKNKFAFCLFVCFPEYLEYTKIHFYSLVSVALEFMNSYLEWERYLCMNAINVNIELKDLKHF